MFPWSALMIFNRCIFLLPPLQQSVNRSDCWVNKHWHCLLKQTGKREKTLSLSSYCPSKSGCANPLAALPDVLNTKTPLFQGEHLW